VRADLARREPLGVKGQHDLIDALEPALPLLDDDRLERSRSVTSDVGLDFAAGLGQHRLAPTAVADVPGPGSGGIMLFVAEVLSDLLLQRRLDDSFGQLLEQPIRPGQGQPLLLSQPDQLGGRLLARR